VSPLTVADGFACGSHMKELFWIPLITVAGGFRGCDPIALPAIDRQVLPPVR
jgi:hypothetical protein